MNSNAPTLFAAGALGVAALAAGCGSTSSFNPSGAGASPTESDASGTFGSVDDDAGGAGSSGSSSFGGGSSGSGSGAATGCDPTCAAAGGKCSGSSCTIAENLGKVATATQTALQGKRHVRRELQVGLSLRRHRFPRGLVAPTLQFGAGAADAEYVHMTSKNLDYRGYFAASAQAGLNLPLPQKSWDAITHAVGATDVLKVSVSKVSGTTVTGPITESWTIAQGSLRGTIYYETYDSTILGGGANDAGGLSMILGSVLAEVTGIGIMKIQPGATQPTPLKSGCGNVCHSASADGSTLVAATTMASSSSYDLKNNAVGALRARRTRTSPTAGSIPTARSSCRRRTSATRATRRRSSSTRRPGATIARSGMGRRRHQRPATTAFSPDGKQIAFVHEDKDGHTLAKMDFDVAHQDVLEPRRPGDRRERVRRLAGVHARREVGRLPRGFEQRVRDGSGRDG